MKDFESKMRAKILPKSIKKSIPNTHMHKRPCWEWFFLTFCVLRPSKTSFSLQRGAKITCSPSSHFSSELFQKVTKNLSKWSSKSPPNTLKYATPKRSRFLLKFVNFLSRQSGPKCLQNASKLEPKTIKNPPQVKNMQFTFTSVTTMVNLCFCS